MASVVAVVIWMKKNGWTRPKNTKVFSWEFMMFQLTRWPWVLLGVLSAIKDLITGKTSEFKVTPKGGNAETPLPLKIIMPYVAIAMASALPAIFIWNVHTAIGYYFFAILNSIIYAVVALAIILLHIHENRFVAKD